MPEILTGGGAPPEAPPALPPCVGGTAIDEEAGVASLGPLSLRGAGDSFFFPLSLFNLLSRPPTPLKAASN